MKKTKVFDQLDSVLGNLQEGKANLLDVVLIAEKVNQYLLENPHPHDIVKPIVNFKVIQK